MTMIVVTHEMSLAQGVVDSLIFVQGGVIACGHPGHMLTPSQHARTEAFLAWVLQGRAPT